ncbi:hypothetical protein IEQ44_07060 [Nocardioides sp. Y6]|uniref:Uncharacterized protein n=1 Tax=Nocardioides malaquae TaxID=2773426 RepID=A0ABR9RS89_9ACTN|nr:hypothetical protein [Nocardioides malaquae]MBE7324408.1 hypothetical protein [Nocardioides malaquae]
MTSTAPALLLAWWGTAWLRGLTSTDHLLEAMTAAAAVHSVHPAPESSPRWDEAEGASLVPLLAALRRQGALSLGATFPAEGDPLGLAGPRELNLDATDVGEALLCPDVGLAAVPHHVGAGMTWVLHPARPRPLPDLGEADRGLRGVMLRSVETLERLDVAAWSPDLADEVLNATHHRPLPSSPGVPDPVRALAGRALSARTIAALALRDHGGAVSAHEVSARHHVVTDLDRAGRVALSAAASPWCWPPGQPEA